MSPSQLYSRVMPYVAGCPEPTVDQAILDAAIEFAERTQIVFTHEAPITLVNGQSTYYVFPEFGLDVDMVQGVHCGTRELIRVTPNSLHDEVPDWQTSISSEPTHFSTFVSPGEITVYPKPASVNGAKLRVMATWAPTMTATSIPDELGKRFFRDLVEGAKARLMLMPDRKWSNPQLGAVAQNAFDSGVVDARIKALHGNAAGTITARPRRFGG